MQNILVIRLSSLGDIVLTLPALHYLRGRYAGARVALAVRERYAPLLAQDPVVDEVIAVAGDMGSAIARLSRERWDLLVDLQGTLRSRRLAAAAPARVKRRVKRDRLARWRLLLKARFAEGEMVGEAGTARGWGEGGSLVAAEGRGTPHHVVERFLEALGSEEVGMLSPCRLALPESSRSRARAFLGDVETGGEVRGQQGEGGFVVLLPGASHPVKAWTPEGFAGVGEAAHRRWGLRAVVLGGPADREIVDEVVRVLTERLGASGRALGLATEDLTFLAALLEGARVAVSNDSGLGHLAAAVGTPVVAVFGPTVIEFGFSPYGDRHRVASLPLDCRPCSLHGNRPCRLGSHRCMRDIPASQVWEIVDEVAGPGG